ncbi:hypothetical protein V8B97DRAFT_1916792 [Scleroderma yunnanense]
MSAIIILQPAPPENPSALTVTPTSAPVQHLHATNTSIDAIPLMSTVIIPQFVPFKNPSALNIMPASALKVEAREDLQHYFLLQQPMWMNQDWEYIDSLAAELAKKFMPDPDAWKWDHLKTFHSTAKSKSGGITSWLGFCQCNNDRERTRGVFNHCTVTTIIQEVIWSSRTKLWKALPPKTQEIDHLIVFTVTMICWALDNMKGGQQTDFDTAVYGCSYKEALNWIEGIRREQNDIELICINHLTHCILQCRKELVAHTLKNYLCSAMVFQPVYPMASPSQFQGLQRRLVEEEYLWKPQRTI